jgi:ribosomal protein S18 acetylase RimI-like enzyme
LLNVVLTTATPDDASAIGALHARSFAVTYPTVPAISPALERSVWRRRAAGSDGREIIVARRGERVVGFAYTGPSDDNGAAPGTGHIYSLHVDPDLHRLGIGRRLLDEITRRFINSGWATATLWVVADNDRARQFYTRLGWVPDGGVEQQSLSLDGDGSAITEVVRYRLSLSTHLTRP